jgi:hypothetical protein
LKIASLIPVSAPVGGFHMTFPMKYRSGNQMTAPMMYHMLT